jgi:phenylacetate-coenzyme A ligase PaaK-like adenylate-forming protein
MEAPNYLDKASFSTFRAKDFEAQVWATYRKQYEENSVYRAYADLLHKNPDSIKTIEAIPFLPIRFFKSHEVVCGTPDIKTIFTSSGTTNTTPSRHLVSDIALYEKSFRAAFEGFYGPTSDYSILALLPSYLEREGSSLIYMVDDLMRRSKHPKNGFYLNEHDALAKQLEALEAQQQPTLLIGVTYALLDFVAKQQFQLKHTLVMETGGMKGRRKEMIRSEVHQKLKEGFGVASIHSEYGMTELLSQAYSKGEGVFTCPPWMHVLVRDPADPFDMLKPNQIGGLNIIDLANQNSCSFIATQDLGRINNQGEFEVLGRFDDAELRGCNLMVV